MCSINAFVSSAVYLSASCGSLVVCSVTVKDGQSALFIVVFFSECWSVASLVSSAIGASLALVPGLVPFCRSYPSHAI